ncbi:MAG: DNA-directed RNA polymerase subunit alpha C-terminal domain-containing protein [Planctomycetota bacterium]|nr:DNA-directed RNA polymerase subunit alpha C-terminal domain-containing protein [Planctomycetota bacterium]
MSTVASAPNSATLKQVVLTNGTFGPSEVQIIVEALAEDALAHRALREAINELESSEDRSPAAAVRLGICFYLLGRYTQAIETLKTGDGGALAHFYMGKSHMGLENYDAAIDSFTSATKAGYDDDICTLIKVECLRSMGKTQQALETLDKLSGAVEQTAEYLFQRGATVAAIGGNPPEVVALLERAVDTDGRHIGALFALAVENDRRGNDEVALNLYERSVSRFPAHVGSLLNLGILYEDRLQYERAHQCYQRVLETFPSHPRARLFQKDVAASRDMFYDEDAQRRRDRLSQVLSVPVTDFELSVRSRNCLQKMGVNTLGDLARTSEAELLASKNFGETSLVEISEMMVSKGLSLGMFANEVREPEPVFEPEFMSPDEQALLDRPISDLNLSVRARKCMIRLGMNTIGELLRKTGDDLLECKNFGVTSLNEVREKLTIKGLKLRGD